MSNLSLHSSLEYVNSIGPEKAILLKQLGLKTCEDLLYYFPFRYVDKSKIYTISQLNSSAAEIQLKGKITSIQEVSYNKKKRIVAIFEDLTGTIELVWFQSSNWLIKSIPLHEEIVIYGKVTSFNSKLNMAHPEIEKISEFKAESATLEPVYSSSEKLQKRGINQRFLKKIVREVLNNTIEEIQENLSNKIISDYKLISRKDAFVEIHFPKNYQSLQKSEYRLKFEEMFFFQLGFGLQKIYRQKTTPGHSFEHIGTYFNEFYNNHLPFSLTSAQKRVIKEIRKDLRQNIQMNRLLQGDVGSGKTMVALLSMLIAIDNGFQATLLAPTEILAMQHFNGISEYLTSMNVSVSLLTGSTSTAERKIIHRKLEEGNLNILIGTHAILEDKVKFSNLGLAIIDEQHRFGVEQRSKLWKKNSIAPHILVMTATPIPRTLAMSYYSDLDVSVIDELPAGRKEIKTYHRTDAQRLTVFKFIRDEIAKGRQVYIVYPLIEESETLDYKDLMDGYESIVREFPLPEYQISIVHGRMKPSDKDYEMQRFINHQTHIMIATTVIEVGVNVPNASVMIIESAEKFGLSQLHQLRGRVGRGAEQSYCILMTKSELNPEALKRITTMCETNDGFRISEVDLELRGPGNLLGTKQSGVIDLKKTNLVQDKIIVSLSKSAVDLLLTTDPKLQLEENKIIKSYFLKHHKNQFHWAKIS
ncbi:ATP-dependent DNA helicase RecG [Apibacter raozihei]|uniref:ATP-dependent DNA helicase RecG n=1 Tax=Apibacter TaxID=1778601 RepID=UPI000FE4257E|nr:MULTISPECIES: ATP-dependent DNA helicase RecG [Apibacter]